MNEQDSITANPIYNLILAGYIYFITCGCKKKANPKRISEFAKSQL